VIRTRDVDSQHQWPFRTSGESSVAPCDQSTKDADGRRTEAIELEGTGGPIMKALLKAVALTTTLLISAAALAGEAVPVNATFGIQWTPENWNPYGADNPSVRETSSFGAAGLPDGKVIAIQSYDFLDTVAGTIHGEAALSFSYEDGVVVEYTGAASFDPQTFTASFFGPMTVIDGWGRFAGSSGALMIRSRILFGPLVGTFDVQGVIKTAK
jgi:hypothetical protein